MLLSSIQRKLAKFLGFDKRFWNSRPNGLYSFNYHRVGDKENTLFDPNVFSCTEERFQQHVQFFTSNFDVVSIDELCSLIQTKEVTKGRYTLLTFDDGYIDNYTTAYPILKQANCPATMFIATDFIDKPILPWWDEAAWLIKNNDHSIFSGLNWGLPDNINTLNTSQKIKLLLRSIKDNKTLSLEEKFKILRDNAQVIYKAESNPSPLFMTWEMLREMSLNNIDIGSQTCSHQILSHLSTTDQLHEIAGSKAILEREIGKTIVSFAYPVGGAEAFTKVTEKIVQESGYHFALSFIPNINIKPDENTFSLNRFSIDNECNDNDIKAYISKATQNLNK